MLMFFVGIMFQIKKQKGYYPPSTIFFIHFCIFYVNLQLKYFSRCLLQLNVLLNQMNGHQWKLNYFGTHWANNGCCLDPNLVVFF